jgi:hypothetical protein
LPLATALLTAALLTALLTAALLTAVGLSIRSAAWAPAFAAAPAARFVALAGFVAARLFAA